MNSWFALERLDRGTFAIRERDTLVATGVASPGADPAVRAAWLLVNDLAVLTLRARLTEVLGVDPLSEPG